VKLAQTGWSRAKKLLEQLVRKCTDYEVDDVRPRRGTKKTPKQIVDKDFQFWQLHKENGMVRNKYRKLTRDNLQYPQLVS